MKTLGQDLRYSLRLLRRQPLVAVMAVLTLAVGIGANTAIFSVVNEVLLRPLPYQDSDRVVMVYKYYEGGETGTTVSGPDFLDYQQRSRLFDSFAAIRGGNATLTGDAEPEQINLAEITPNFFALFKVDPVLGQHFTAEDAVPEMPRVVIISHSLWQRRFGGNPALLGKPIQLSGNPFLVAGILPTDFKLHLPPLAFLLKEADVYLPMNTGFISRAQRTNNFLTAFGRIKAGVTLQQAEAEMENIAAQLREEHLEFKHNRMQIGMIPLHEAIVKNIRPTLWLLLAAVGFVLAIACANVANLMFVRVSVRAKEIAIRSALGASRGRIVRQILVEGFLFSLGGGLIGLLLAYWGLKLLLTLRPSNLPQLESVGLDASLLSFSLITCLLTPFLFGLPAAWRASRGNLNGVLKEGGQTGGGLGSKKLHHLLVAGELALSLVLLIGAGLLIKTFASLQAVKLGFTPERVLTFQVLPPYPRYGRLGWERHAAFYRQLEERLAVLPGVEAVGVTSQVPLSGSGHWADYSWDEDSRQNQPAPVADWRFVTPNYFNVVGAKLLAGRFFTEQDGANHPRVTIIDQTLARKAWPNESPLGKRLRLPHSTPRGIEDVWMEVVGVIEPMRSHKLTEHVREQFFIPYAQNPAIANLIVTVRTNVAPFDLLNAIRQEVYALDKEIPVYKVRLMEDYVAEALAPARFSLMLMSIFSAVALILAAVGLYGLVSYWVSQRTQEIGIRMALGAQRLDIFRLVVGQGMITICLGVSIGLIASFALTRFLAGLLFGVSATDPLTFAAVAGVLTGVAWLACIIPARRAAKVDPMVALRYE
jgi:putative ABC transport system permease protein